MKVIDSSLKSFFLSFLIVILFCSCGLFAKPMNSGQRAVSGYTLESHPKPFKTQIASACNTSGYINV